MAINTPYGKKRSGLFIILFTLWWGTWMALHANVLAGFGIPYWQAITDAAISYFLLAAICLLINNNMRYYLPQKEKYLYAFIVSLSLSFIWLLAIRFSLWLFFKGDLVYMQQLIKTTIIRYILAFLMIATITMALIIWYTNKNQQEDNLRMLDAERLAKEAELNKLRQQLQPHFLFNSLNSISALTGTQPEKARHMIQQLADFLRGTLKKEEEQSTTFEEELQYLQLYLDIEKVRFGYRLQTNIAYNDDTLQMKLPALLLQPLVENAIKFGLYDTIGEVIIFIEATNNNGLLQVSVKNPFDESTSPHMKGTGFGLSSIRRRLFLLFGRHDLLVINKEAQQFITQITIPQSI